MYLRVKSENYSEARYAVGDTTTSDWVRSFLTAHQHILGYLVSYNDVRAVIKERRYRPNQGYVATIKHE